MYKIFMSNNFAVLDDSLCRTRCGIFVYSHCLIVNGYEPEFLTIIGNKTSVYQENNVIKFIEDLLPENYLLYACSHYFQMYSKLTKLINNEINRKHCRKKNYPIYIIDLFKEADTSARSESRRQLKNLIAQSNIL